MHRTYGMALGMKSMNLNTDLNYIRMHNRIKKAPNNGHILGIFTSGSSDIRVLIDSFSSLSVIQLQPMKPKS